jgi:uncharacterized membrane protein (UPF0182 family)
MNDKVLNNIIERLGIKVNKIETELLYIRENIDLLTLELNNIKQKISKSIKQHEKE